MHKIVSLSRNFLFECKYTSFSQKHALQHRNYTCNYTFLTYIIFNSMAFCLFDKCLRLDNHLIQQLQPSG